MPDYATETAMNTDDEEQFLANQRSTAMARPKSTQPDKAEMDASNEAMRVKVAGEHQADPARRQFDPAEPADHPFLAPPKPAGSLAAEADAAFGHRKSDEQPHVGEAGREPFRNREAPNDIKSDERPADIHGMQAEVNSGPKAEKDQKPTAEFNVAVSVRPELLDPSREGRREIPADKRMFISDDLAAELSNKFAHHEISYTETGIMVRSGGESIMIDEAKIGKFETRADLRRYIDTLPVIRHG